MADSIKGANRKLKMILMLQSQKEITATTLAKYFGVSKRTIFRDLRALSEMNVPITHDPDFGYSLVSGYKIPPLMFTEKK
jgi:predicted DNA-binding transcriptional regulator YafY